MSERRVRVRFAPSPTGPLHMGGVRTALFNYLFARKHGGDFLLRIEDTDQTRYVPGAEQYIIEALRWCGLNYDEGVDIGGPCAPYRQSDRKELYHKYAMQLIDSGHAYYAFDTPEELEKKREEWQNLKLDVQQYNAVTRGELKNSLTLSAQETQQLLDSGMHYVVRFKMPEDENIVVNDIIRGEITVHSTQVDDKVLYKSDGMPTYHLANVVDDYLMNISHVIRGEEWLPSLPLHVMLYRAFDWLAVMPQFAHLPLLLKPEGKGKLSKRDGDKMGFPVFPLEWKDPFSGEVSSGYREKGYFQEAFVNLLALLGWNPGTEQEIFSMDELINAFDLDKVGKSGSKFDPEKAKWFNQQYLRMKSDEELSQMFLPIVQQRTVIASMQMVRSVVPLVKERAQFVHEMWEQTSFFFDAPAGYEEKAVKKTWKENSVAHLQFVKEMIESEPDMAAAHFEPRVKDAITENGFGMGAVLNALRLALVGELKGPHLFDIMRIIGKENTLARINKAIAYMSQMQTHTS